MEPIGASARIMLEQGIFGLLLWAAFLIWLFMQPASDAHDSWREGRRLARWACMLVFGTGLIGVGTFVTVPQTCLLLICAGWLAARQQVGAAEEEGEAAAKRRFRWSPVRPSFTRVQSAEP